MKNHCLLIVTAVFLCLGMGTVFAQAQDRDQLRISKLSVDEVDTPDYNPRVEGLEQGAGSTQKEDWLVLRTDYQTAAHYLDEVTFTYYVLLEAQDAKDVETTTRKKDSVFSGSVTYEHVAKGKHSSTFFMHPHIYKRYGEFKQAAVVVSVKGAPVDMAAQGGNEKERWWEKATPIPGHMLPRNKTPFVFSEYESYEYIKLDSK